MTGASIEGARFAASGLYSRVQNRRGQPAFVAVSNSVMRITLSIRFDHRMQYILQELCVGQRINAA